MSAGLLQPIKYQKGELSILDQLLLPIESKYIQINNVADGWRAIKSMQVRGAPAIGVVGCLSLAVELHRGSYSSKESMHADILKKLDYLVTSRPTAVNLVNEANKLRKLSEEFLLKDVTSSDDMKEGLINSIEALLEKDIYDNKAIGKYGGESIISLSGNSGLKVLTHCNTGSLATVQYGTALGVIRYLFQNKHLEEVFCTETRPYLQGARLTAYELVSEGISGTLVCDSMVGALLRSTKISAVLVGADRVAANGDTANKIGTYQIAVLAKQHQVPFYVCAPSSSIDFTIKTGDEIVIEERPEHEVTHILGQRIAAPGIKVWNPSFDVTPASLITGIVTERGTFLPDQLTDLLLNTPVH